MADQWQASHVETRGGELESSAETVWERSSSGRALVRSVQARVDVSAQVATIRLRQLGRLSVQPVHIVRVPVPRPW